MDLELSVFNASGQKIKTLHAGFQGEGEHHILCDGSSERGQYVDPGVYFCILRTKSGIVTRKLTRVR